jgi:hypothetical protein
MHAVRMTRGRPFCSLLRDVVSPEPLSRFRMLWSVRLHGNLREIAATLEIHAVFYLCLKVSNGLNFDSFDAVYCELHLVCS